VNQPGIVDARVHDQPIALPMVDLKVILGSSDHVSDFKPAPNIFGLRL
jgi:hypothetical protein